MQPVGDVAVVGTTCLASVVERRGARGCENARALMLPHTSMGTRRAAWLRAAHWICSVIASEYGTICVSASLMVIPSEYTSHAGV